MFIFAWITVEKLKDSFSMSWHWSYAFAWWNRFRNVIQTRRYALRSCRRVFDVHVVAEAVDQVIVYSRSHNLVDRANPLLSSCRLVGQVKWFSFRGSVNFQLFPPLDIVICCCKSCHLYISVSVGSDASSFNERSKLLFSTPRRVIGGSNLWVMLGFEPQTILLFLRSTNFIEIIQLVLVC